MDHTRRERIRAPHWPACMPVFVFLLGMSVSAGQAADTRATGESVATVLTLPQVWSELSRANPELAVRAASERAAASRIGPAGAWDNPMLMLGAMNVPTNLRFDMEPMTMMSVGLTQNFPVNGARGLQRRAARSALREEEATTGGVRAEQLALAYGAFADLAFARDLQRVVAEQRVTLQRVADAAQSRISTGSGGVEDVLRARADLARLIEDRSALAREETMARASLNAILGRPIDTAIGDLAEVPEPDLPESAAAWTTRLDESVPALRALTARTAAFEARRAASRRAIIPDLSLSLAYGKRRTLADGTPQDNMWTLQASAALPIFAASKERPVAAEMGALADQATGERVATRLRVERDLVSLHAEARRARETATTYAHDILPLDRQAVEVILAGFVSGRDDYLRVQGATIALYRDTITSLRARQAYTAALAQALRWTDDPTILGLPAAPAERSGR